MEIEIKQPGILYLSQAQYDIRVAVKECTYPATQIAKLSGVSYSTLQYTTRGVHEPSESVAAAILGAVDELNRMPKVKIIKEPKFKRKNKPKKTEYKSRIGSSIYLSERQHMVRVAVIDSSHTIEKIAEKSGVSDMTIRYWITGLNEPRQGLLDAVLQTIKLLPDEGTLKLRNARKKIYDMREEEQMEFAEIAKICNRTHFAVESDYMAHKNKLNKNLQCV